MDPFEQQADAVFIDKLTSYLLDEQADDIVELPCYSCLLEEVPDDALLEMIRNGIERARGHGLTWETSMGDFVSLMFSVAPNFDEHPLIRRVLEDGRMPVDERVDVLFEIISEETWARAIEDYDPAAWGVELPEEFQGISAGRFTGDPLILDPEDEEVNGTPVPVCPACSVAVVVNQSVAVGSKKRCDACGTDLEIIQINPLELEFIYGDDLDKEGDIDEVEEFEEIEADESPNDVYDELEDTVNEEREG